jgi:type II secretory pathway component PulJ
VLLAVAVFGILLVAINGVFYGALRLRNQTAAAIEQAVPMQQALAIIKRDLANLVVPGGTLAGELQTSPATGLQSQSNQTDQATQPSAGYSSFNSVSAKGQIVSPTFATAAGIINDSQPWGEVERVLYYLAEPTNHAVGRDLIRSVTRNLLPTLPEQPVDQWLMSGVQEMAFTFFDGSQWQETWDSSLLSSNKLPQAIKLQLLLVPAETENQAREPITLVVPLIVQSGSNAAAQTTGGSP